MLEWYRLGCISETGGFKMDEWPGVLGIEGTGDDTTAEATP